MAICKTIIPSLLLVAVWLGSGTHVLAQPIPSVSQLSDVQPTDWAFQALRSLIEQYGCLNGYPDQTFRGNQSLTRFEFAAGLNACLDRMNELVSAPTDSVKKEDLLILQRLQSDYTEELATLRGRIDALEARTDTLEQQQFSTTTKLTGEAIFAVSGAFGNDRAVPNGTPAGSAGSVDENLIFTNRVRLSLNTSFTGRDLLRIRLQSGNTPNLRTATGTSMTRLGFDGNTQNSLTLNQLFYQFPLGNSARAAIFARGAIFDFVDPINPLLGSDSRGSISTFGLRSPIYREELGGSGASLSYDISPAVNLSLVYLASQAEQPGRDRGLFGGSYSALGQVTFKPSSSFTVGLTYARSYNAIDIGTTSAIANDPFGGNSDRVIGNSYSLSTSWLINSRLRIGGWVGFLQVTAEDLINDPQADIFYYALNIGLPDLGGKGNLAGFVFGQPPRVTRNEFGLRDGAPSLHFEAFYRIQATDQLAITPGIIVITNPEHNGENGALYIGTLRTLFSF